MLRLHFRLSLVLESLRYLHFYPNTRLLRIPFSVEITILLAEAFRQRATVSRDNFKPKSAVVFHPALCDPDKSRPQMLNGVN